MSGIVKDKPKSNSIHIPVMAGGLTLGMFLMLPYAHLMKSPATSELEVISIEKSDWLAPPQMPIPKAKEVEQETVRVSKPALVATMREVVPLKAVLDFEMNMLDVGGDFGMSFSIDPLAGGIGSAIFEMNDVDNMPQPLVQLRPHYPAHARMRRVEGNVSVMFVVNENGRTENIRILSSSPANIFNESATRAVERWKFAPGVHDGSPVAVQVRQNIRFELE